MIEETKTPAKRRISITKLQRESEVAAELISLCQTVTEDGHLDEAEVRALREWLVENRKSDLPAVDFLVETVEHILEDERVTPDEHKQLFAAIESVLPPDVRESVRGIRIAVDRAAKERTRELKAALKDAKREARERNAAVGRWDFMVAGCRYDGRPEVIRDFAEPDDEAFLVRDPENRHSRNAVEVRLSNGSCVGYVPEEFAADIAPLLDAGHKQRAYLKKILGGRSFPIPVVVASIHRGDADEPDLRGPTEVEEYLAERRHSMSRAKSGCLKGAALIAGLVLVGTVLLAV